MEATLEDTERRLRIELMQADIANSEYKKGLLKYEPWKVMATVMLATASVFPVVGGVIGYLIGHLH
ncbi:MAG: hypothetical protein ACREF1_12350 [Acetobacteraceae bacterium]